MMSTDSCLINQTSSEFAISLTQPSSATWRKDFIFFWQGGSICAGFRNEDKEMGWERLKLKHEAWIGAIYPGLGGVKLRLSNCKTRGIMKWTMAFELCKIIRGSLSVNFRL